MMCRLSFLGEGVRTLLVFEVRAAVLVATTAINHNISLLPPNCQAMRCSFRCVGSPSGPILTVHCYWLWYAHGVQPLLSRANPQSASTEAVSQRARPLSKQ